MFSCKFLRLKIFKTYHHSYLTYKKFILKTLFVINHHTPKHRYGVEQFSQISNNYILSVAYFFIYKLTLHALMYSVFPKNELKITQYKIILQKCFF